MTSYFPKVGDLVTHRTTDHPATCAVLAVHDHTVWVCNDGRYESWHTSCVCPPKSLLTFATGDFLSREFTAPPAGRRQFALVVGRSGAHPHVYWVQYENGVTDVWDVRQCKNVREERWECFPR